MVSRAAPRSYWYVWWGTLINRLGGFVIPLITIYLTKERGYSVGEAGGVVSIFGLGQVIASIIGGQLADRVGRRATMVMSLFGGAIAMAALVWAHSLTEIAIMVGVVGLVGELYRPAVGAFIADVIPPEHRIEAYGLLHWVINIGFAFAAIAGGMIADLDFRVLFVGDAVTMAIYGVIVLVAVPETKPPAAPENPDNVTAKPSASWLTDMPFVVFIVLSFFLTLLPIQSGAPLAAHMTDQGFSSSAYGLAMGVNGLLIIATQPLLAAWAQTKDPNRVLVLAVGFYAVGFALHGAGPFLVVHCAAVAIWTLGEILESPTRSAIVANLSPADARGRYQGATVMAWGLGYFVGPWLGTTIWEATEPPVLWLGCFGLGIAVAVVTALTGPMRRRAISARSPSGSS